MCGINGIVSFGSFNHIEPTVDRMNQALAHRGPDGKGISLNNNIGLGHRRLAIIDISDKGNQPIFSVDKRYSLVFNGELYNYQELKTQYCSNYQFTSNTDSEVVLAMYAKFKEKCLDHFNGMFAFAIYDHLENNLFIARDRMGIKPLYYFQNEAFFIFSSEIRALLSSNLVPKKINLEYLPQYLRQQTIYEPNTIIKDIKSLPSGMFLTIKNNRVEFNRYYNLQKSIQKEPSYNYQEIKHKTKQLFLDSVKLRMQADVPYGAFLSGGIDSSAIVAAMRQTSVQKTSTFSIIFEDPSFNEEPYSDLIAKKYHTDHTKILLKPNELLDVLPQAMQAMDHPGADGINTYLVSQVTREKGIKMALSGLGGDELFAGYSLFTRLTKLEQQKSKLKFAPLLLQKQFGKLLKLKGGISNEKLAEYLNLKTKDLPKTHDILRSAFSLDQINKILNVPYQNNMEMDLLGKEHTLSNISILEYETYLKHVLLRDSDQMSMAHALEVRVPFLDHHLVEYVLGVQDQFKFPHTPKKLLVDSLGTLIPQEIVNRPKMGFTFPWKHWLKNELRALANEKIKNISSREEFNESAIQQLWQQFLKNDPAVNWSRVWLLIALEWWLENNDV